MKRERLNLLILGLLWVGNVYGGSVTARCNGLQFHFNDEGGSKAVVMMETTGGSFQLAQGKLVIKSATTLKAAFDGLNFGGDLVTFIGIDKSTKTVFAEYLVHDVSSKKGIFCKAEISEN